MIRYSLQIDKVYGTKRSTIVFIKQKPIDMPPFFFRPGPKNNFGKNYDGSRNQIEIFNYVVFFSFALFYIKSRICIRDTKSFLVQQETHKKQRSSTFIDVLHLTVTMMSSTWNSHFTANFRRPGFSGFLCKNNPNILCKM